MKQKLWAAAAVAFLGAGVTSVAFATHSWNNYHWARTTSSFTLKVIDNVNGPWQAVLQDAVNNWSTSNVLNLTIVAGDDSTRARKQCRAVAGHIKVCNAAYGLNGWLGLASINLDSQGHISQGTSKMNDSYSSYWTPEERNHVMCQEIGHDFGLGHTSEDGSSQGTCMDYSSDPSSQWPNQHDYDMLAQIYAHLDSYNSYNASSAAAASSASNAADFGNDNVPMGLLVHKHERYETWVAAAADGSYWVHHVTLAPSRR